MMPVTTPSPSRPREGPSTAAVRPLVAARDVRSVYQPIVDLQSANTVGYEALARGPAGSALECPDRLFAAALEAGCLTELDWTCRIAAVRGAHAGGLAPPLSLFVNVEPLALDSSCPPDLEAEWQAAARRGQRLIIEVTERALTARPAEMLAALARVRARGWGVAIDDVGADPRSLALMPLLEPDVTKLDLRLVQERPTADVAAIFSAVGAEAERTGAHVLAEGIETPQHLAMARSLGATLGQGYWFGRPGPLSTPPPLAVQAIDSTRSAPMPAISTPFERVARRRGSRPGTKALLLAVTRQLEQEAAGLGLEAIVLSTFQEARHFTPATAELYTRLAGRLAFVSALGADIALEPAPGVRGAALAHDDPVRGEWDVIVLGPHFSAALVARDLGDDGPEPERRFDFAVTYERSLVLEAALAAMSRIAPAAPPRGVPRIA